MLLRNALLVQLCAAVGSTNGTTTLLVVGGSWGSLGPSYRELQDMFARHGVNATVRSAAVGGTSACEWAAQKPNGMIAAAEKLFPEAPPDFVWYTLGEWRVWGKFATRSCIVVEPKQAQTTLPRRSISRALPRRPICKSSTHVSTQPRSI